MSVPAVHCEARKLAYRQCEGCYSIVRNIRTSPLSNAELARQYGVAKEVVRNARIGVTWKHIP